MANSLLMLLDDITTVLDDIALLTKLSAQKTAGVLGDDLALNVQQVSGVHANRELPVVWAVAKGSFVNKAILVPLALALGTLTPPWVIQGLLVIGGLYLCYEGSEKLAHKFFHLTPAEPTEEQLISALRDPNVDLVQLEKNKIKGAIRTDFVLSAEIIVITLGMVTSSPFLIQMFVLIAISLLMTVGVYGLVAGIVKLDDLGTRLIESGSGATELTIKQRIGYGVLAFAPKLMKFLSIAGTAAMFLVGGGILVHAVQSVTHSNQEMERIGGFVSGLIEMIRNGLVGVVGGAIVLLVISMIRRLRTPQSTASHPTHEK